MPSSSAGSSHGTLRNPGVSVLFELQRQGLVATLDNAAIGQYMHEIRNDVIKQALVVGNDDEKPGTGHAWR
jgi:hypothetical protein